MAPVAKADGIATECMPVRSLDELHAWKKPSYTDRFPAPPLAHRSPAVSGKWADFSYLRPLAADGPSARTLLCHDFKGGYNEDRFADGCRVEAFPYLFQRWSLIDSFCYFSHHFVTIPPPGWIAAAHRYVYLLNRDYYGIYYLPLILGEAPVTFCEP